MKALIWLLFFIFSSLKQYILLTDACAGVEQLIGKKFSQPLRFFSKESAEAANRPKLLIDQDGGADDAMAIFMALLNEKYFNGPEVIALTTTHGNVDEDQVFNNTQRILTIADRRDIPIYRGSSNSLIMNYASDYYFGYDGLGDNFSEYEPIAAENEHAVLGLIELSKKHEGELIVVTLGALTNVALAIRLDPEFMSRLSHLYVAAGNIYEKHIQPEFNAIMDAEAYHIIVEKGAADKLTVIPYSQIRSYLRISKEWRRDVLGVIDTKIMRAQNIFERKSFNTSSNWCLLDPSTMAIALKYSILDEIRYSRHSIILCGRQRGINTNNFTTISDANAQVAYRMNLKPYKQFLYDLFSADLCNK